MAPGVSASMALTLAGFCFSVIFIVFVCFRLVCALLRRRRSRSRRSPALPQYAVAGYSFAVHVARPAAGGGGGGLDPASVAAFPTRAFAGGPRGSGASDADSQCIICLAEYEEKDVLRILPSCCHNFHMACIDMWLEQNSTCPVCRISLRDNPDSTHAAPPPLPSVVISPPCSPRASRSDPCHCLFVSTGHSSRASEILRHEPDQENQTASGRLPS
ncbi:RING-H2 finger protein ATL39-like [Phragmites australis]|uniref:RING-H2 finger protein ATL39-like n=1 Tax=Phragmites australis TaxID=29695 RepID=UPI002D789212|nr:RING-H2 finger protein ATL39-like [Phragmites australis]